MLVLDCEIKRAIPPKGGQLQVGIDYCQGWDDYEGMGLACCCVYDYYQGRYRVFGEHEADRLQQLINSRGTVVGFNNWKFDRQLLLSCLGITIPHHYDILREIWKALGLDPDTYTEAHRGISLNALAELNLGTGKALKGGLAPILWQQGHYTEVIDYCLEDVRLTMLLLEKIYEGELLRLPYREQEVKLPIPEAVLYL